MVNSFKFSRLPAIFFGAGELSRFSKIVESYGKKVLIITGEKSFRQTSHFVSLTRELNKKQIQFFLADISKEPTPVMIDSIAEQHRESHIDIVAAIGGGSVIDAGKAVSAMLRQEGSVRDYLEGVGTKEPDGKKIPFIAVPTTSGTGSEATKNAVISEIGEKGFKKSLRHDNYIPDIAIIDPLLTLSCPPDITASSGMDAFTQLLESYVSSAAGNLTDALAWEGLNLISKSLVQVYEDGTKTDARSMMSLAAFYSGITLANAGLGTIHGFASSIGGFFDIPHGVVCSAMMPITNKYTIQKLISSGNSTTFSKYIKVARLFIKDKKEHDEYYLKAFPEFLIDLARKLKIPKLSGYGITSDHFPQIINKTGNKNNPVEFSKDELIQILEESIDL